MCSHPLFYTIKFSLPRVVYLSYWSAEKEKGKKERERNRTDHELCFQVSQSQHYPNTSQLGETCSFLQSVLCSGSKSMCSGMHKLKLRDNKLSNFMTYRSLHFWNLKWGLCLSASGRGLVEPLFQGLSAAPRWSPADTAKGSINLEPAVISLPGVGGVRTADKRMS